MLYLAVGFVALGVLGAPALAASEAPILDAAEAIAGPLARPAIVAAAVVAIGTSLNAIFAIFSRSLLAMAEAGMLPAALARIHPRTGVPHIALIVVFAIGCAGLALPMELTFLFLAVNIPTILKYASICVVAAKVAIRHPDIHRRASMLRNPTLVIALAAGGAIGALVLAAAGFQADWRPYALLAGWTLLGAIVYAIGRKHHRLDPDI